MEIEFQIYDYSESHDIDSTNSVGEYIINVFKETLCYHKKFILHINSNHLTMMDIDKYYLFINFCNFIIYLT